MEDFDPNKLPTTMDEFEEQFGGIQARIEARAMEALQELFHRLPFGEEITLADGSRARFKKFVEPKICQTEGNQYQGNPSAGFDVIAVDGSWHLEFYIFQTGWGGAVG